MQIPLILLKHIAKASLNFIGAGVAGEIVFDIAEEVMKHWKADKDEAARKAELVAIAQATTEEIKSAIEQVLEQVAAGSQREAIANYLMHVPASIRQTFRRATDPSGKTIPPGLNMRETQDLAAILPARLSKFRPGDFPIPGVSRKLVELIGVGGFGEVWKAINPDLPGKPPVALKFSNNPADKAELLHQATLLNRIFGEGRQGGIVELIDTYLSAATPCLEYEYVAGGELAGLIREYHARGGLTPADSAKIVYRLAKTVGYFHKLNPPIVHRDLKPANILVHSHSPGKISFKIADFGIGQVAAKGEISRSQTQMDKQGKLYTIAKGSYTPLYASPQQIGCKSADPRDDVHALGVIWFQLLTGDLTRGAPTGHGWINQLKSRGMSQELIDLLASCFDSDQNERPADAEILAEKISSLITPPRPSECLYIKSSNASASGMLTPNGFVVLKGSEARVKSANTIPPSAVRLRNELLETGVLSIKDENHYVFNQDYKFRTSSSAASVVLASSAAGPAEWRDQTGKRLRAILKDMKNS